MPLFRHRPLAVLTAVLTALTLQGLHTAPDAAAGTRSGGGRVNIIANHSGLCLEVDNSRVTAGTQITQNRCTGQQGAVWTLRESAVGAETPGGKVAVQLYNRNSDKCLEIAPPTPSGLRLAQAAVCSDSRASSFRVEDREHYAWLRSVEDPLKCLEIAAGSHVNHTVARLAPCDDQSGTAFRQRPPRIGDDPPRDPRRFGIERVNITSFGEQTADGMASNDTLDGSSMSADNRYVTFVSAASTLVADDTNAKRDVFLRDRHTAELRRISVPYNGGQTAEHSNTPRISGNGRYVVFDSGANNLVPGDTNNAWDVFLYDAETHKIELISKNTAGDIGTHTSGDAAVSDDGRYVVFQSVSDNFAPGEPSFIRHIFIRDRTTGITKRISSTSSGTPGNGWSWDPNVSADGRFVTFSSRASDLVAGDANGVFDVFLWTRQTDTLRRVTTPASAPAAADGSSEPVVSADGAFVAFTSDLPLVSGDTNAKYDVYLWNRRSGTTERVSLGNGGVQGQQDSYTPSISANGLYVAFTSEADAFAPGNSPGRDVFVRDAHAGTTVHASVSDEGVMGDGHSFHAEISADGRFVSFESTSANLAFGDTNNASDLFVKPRPVDLT